jgi:hypothetical protein
MQIYVQRSFFLENLAVYKTMRENIVKPHGTNGNMLRLMRTACCIATDTHLECIILIFIPP